MAENSGKVAIVIALITTAGVLGAKYIEVGGRRSDGREAGVSSSSAVKPPLPAAASIDGAWQDQFGSRFQISTEDGKLNLTGNNGDKRMTGSGTVSGTTVTAAITDNISSGVTLCVGEIFHVASIQSICAAPHDGPRYDWRLTR